MQLYLWKYIIPDALNYTEKPPHFQCENVIDDACAVVWCERYQEPGEISVQLRATAELLRLFWENEIMITRPDTDRAMFVDDVLLTTSDDGDYIQITGKSAEGIIERRVIGQRGAITGDNAAHAIRYYMQENIASYWYFHTDEEHQHGQNNPYSRMYVNLLRAGADDERITETISAEPFGKNLSSFVTEICKGAGFGFRIVFDGEDLIYSCYKGENRTLNQSERNAVVFSDDFMNIGNSEYRFSRKSCCTHVIAGGSGSGSTREYGESFKNFRSAKGAGLNLRQKFVNASGVSGNMLRTTAQNEVLSASESVSFSAEATGSGPFAYRKDYFLGDRVSVVNRYWISGTATISEVVETEDENGYFVIPKLSDFAVDDVVTPERPDKAVYKRLEYIQTHGDGGEYVVTDIIPDYTMKVEISVAFPGSVDYSVTSDMDKMLFGYIGSNGAFSIHFSGTTYWSGAEDVAFIYGFSWYSGITGEYISRNASVAGTTNALLQHGTSHWKATPVTVDKEYTSGNPSTGMVIFGGRISDGTIKPMKRRAMRLYSFRLYKDDALLHELVPAERQGDGAAGLLDLSTKSFYENAGSGEFIKGGYIEEDAE